MNKTYREPNDQRGRTRTIQGDERRRSLVLAAYQLIAEKGFEHLRTREVAAQAGVNIATLHYYFASKEDLIRGVVDHLLHEFETAPAPIPEFNDTTPLGQIHAMFLMTHARFQTAPELFIVLSELVLHSLHDGSIRPALHRLDNEWHAYLQSLITHGIHQRLFRTDLDPQSTATSLIMLMKGFFFHQITSPASVDLDQLLNDIERLLLC